jgi:hypothetical protein
LASPVALPAPLEKEAVPGAAPIVTSPAAAVLGCVLSGTVESGALPSTAHLTST